MRVKKMMIFFLGAFFLLTSKPAISSPEGKALLLQDMAWTDVREYLKKNDMVIIPLGSTEQHGPHLPLGTDFYEALAMSKMISARTGVVVAPVLFAGYSEYHSGFPGTLSLKPETMEEVLFETAHMLMKYGFRRFLFFNYHGGNRIIEQNVIHRVNKTTRAVAVSIGIGSPAQKEEEGEFFDWHAGVSETSIMLYLKPELVRMERAEKPVIRFTPRQKKLLELSKENPALASVFSSLLGVEEETEKGGSSAELSSNGIWSFSDPKKATAERGEKEVKAMVDAAVQFIEAWKRAEGSEKRVPEE